MGLVIDTSALVALERGAGAGLPMEELLAIPAIVWAEALIGVRLADTPARAAARRARLEVMRAQFGIQAFTDVVAEAYAGIYADLAERGELIPQNDMAVAATARVLGYAVLVGPKDEVHFKKVPGLEVRVLGR